MTEIVAVSSAFPAYRYPQAELTRAVVSLSAPGRGQRALLERLHANAGVDTRHTVLPLAEYGTLGDAGATINDRYIDEATALGERALRAALAEAGRTPADLDLLIVTSASSEGTATPVTDVTMS